MVYASGLFIKMPSRLKTKAVVVEADLRIVSDCMSNV